MLRKLSSKQLTQNIRFLPEFLEDMLCLDILEYPIWIILNQRG